MNREDIISMAREAGFEELFKDSHDWVCFTEEIERFFQAAFAAGAAAEREALAQFFQDHWRETWTDLQIAEAIRARGNT